MVSSAKQFPELKNTHARIVIVGITFEIVFVMNNECSMVTP